LRVEEECVRFVGDINDGARRELRHEIPSTDEKRLAVRFLSVEVRFIIDGRRGPVPIKGRFLGFGVVYCPSTKFM
jgi:hypothetical protein